MVLLVARNSCCSNAPTMTDLLAFYESCFTGIWFKGLQDTQSKKTSLFGPSFSIWYSKAGMIVHSSAVILDSSPGKLPTIYILHLASCQLYSMIGQKQDGWEDIQVGNAIPSRCNNSLRGKKILRLKCFILSTIQPACASQQPAYCRSKTKLWVK